MAPVDKNRTGGSIRRGEEEEEEELGGGAGERKQEVDQRGRKKGRVDPLSLFLSV